MDMKTLPIIDPHQHFWDLSMNKHPWLCHETIPFRYGDYAAIRENFLPDDYKAVSANHNVVKTVHQEAEWDTADPVAETIWIHDLYDRTGYPHAAIGQAWFMRDDIAEVLAGHAAYPLMRSVRQKPAAAPSRQEFVPGAPGSLADPKFREGFKLLQKHGLHYDIQTPWCHLGEAADLARDFPDTLIILNHTGLPSDRSAEGLAGWREGMEVFADQPNTAVKISGIGLPGIRWTAENNAEVVLETIRIFGAERCMFASNFPVDSLAGSFDKIYDGFKTIVADFPEDQIRALFHDNAQRIYRPV